MGTWSWTGLVIFDNTLPPLQPTTPLDLLRDSKLYLFGRHWKVLLLNKFYWWQWVVRLVFLFVLSLCHVSFWDSCSFWPTHAWHNPMVRLMQNKIVTVLRAMTKFDECRGKCRMPNVMNIYTNETSPYTAPINQRSYVMHACVWILWLWGQIVWCQQWLIRRKENVARQPW